MDEVYKMSDINNWFPKLDKLQDDLLTNVRRQIDKVMETTRQTIELHLGNLDIDSIMLTMYDVAESGARNGWTIPPHLTFAECQTMMDEKNSSELDRNFEQHYSMRDNFVQMKSRLLTSAIGQKWHELLEDCFTNFEQNRYKITIPSLFLMLEGTVIDAAQDESLTMGKAIKRIEQLLPKNRVRGFVLLSALHFLNFAFERGHFEQPRDIHLIINRHWVLHGRDQVDEWTKVDALRLFNALYSLTMLKLLDH